MAIKKLPGVDRQRSHAHTYGKADWKYVEWDVSTFAQNDDILLWKVPNGARIFRVEAVVSDVEGSAATLDVGYIDQAGADDKDYFITAASLNALAVTDSLVDTRHAPYQCQGQEVYLSGTLKGAAIDMKTVVRFYVQYEYEGSL